MSEFKLIDVENTAAANTIKRARLWNPAKKRYLRELVVAGKNNHEIAVLMALTATQVASGKSKYIRRIRKQRTVRHEPAASPRWLVPALLILIAAILLYVGRP